jgi:uncharacterized protein (TIGR00369 family)
MPPSPKHWTSPWWKWVLAAPCFRAPPGRGYTTAELGVNLVKALTPKVTRVRAEGKVIHCGRQLATAEARLIRPVGTLYAHATTTRLVFELPKK